MERIENKKYLLISVKPEFANKILNNSKTIELRKTKPNVNIGDYIVIYASSPVKAILGFGLIKQVIDTSPTKMWEINSLSAGIDKQRFDDYYKDRQRAIGIEIENIKQINPIPLSDLRLLEVGFHPPQIYRYISDKIFKEFTITL